MGNKIQRIKRSNGSVTHHVVLPKHIIDRLRWKKGDELDFKVDVDGSVKMRLL